MRYQIKVSPNAKISSVQQYGGILKVKVDALPKEGKANRRLIEILAEHFKVSPSRIFIISGLTSRDKAVEIL